MEDLSFSSIFVILLETTNMLLTPPLTPPFVMTQLSSSSLSNALKVGMQVSHKNAESVHLITEFIKGTIDSGLYKMLMLNLYHLHERLEELMQVHASVEFLSLYYPKELN